MIKEIYKYRELLKSNVKKEIRGKYKGSFLGVLWSFVNPLLSVLVYAIVFPIILKSSQEHYVTYLIVGLLPWTFFTTAIANGTSTILANAGIIKKVYFPREILPISVVVSSTVNFVISCIVIAIFLLCSGIGFSWVNLYLPIIILAEFLLCLGIVFITGAINVYIRDAEYIINFFISMLFYATPILYSADLFPTSIRWILDLNPMAIIIGQYRDCLFYQVTPNIVSLIGVIIFGIILSIVGYFVFKKLEKGFAEEV